MSDPTPYTVSYSFSGFQANSPTTPLPAPALDSELAGIAAAVAQIVLAVKDIRRSDGALQNNIVTFDSLAESLQLTFDPTNGELVAAAIATAEAAAAAAGGSATAAGGSATSAASSAAAAAASAGSVDLTNYLPKNGNLAGLNDPNVSRANVLAAKVDGSDMTGRLAPTAGAIAVTDWNAQISSGWSSGQNALNSPPGGDGWWVVQTIAYNPFYNIQIAYPFTAALVSGASVTPFRRCSYDSGGGVIAWRAWESASPIPVGSTVWVNATTAPAGFLKENGSLLSRASYPALYTFAAASGNIVSEASWAGGNYGGFSTGDLSTTFRLPDTRAEFTRNYDDGRGVDSGRGLGAWQVDLLRDHTHGATQPTGSYNSPGGATNVSGVPSFSNTSGVNGGLGGVETRPRNIAKLACIKY